MTQSERKLLQHVARNTERKYMDGWVRYGTTGPAWDWDTYRPLVARGLLDRKEDWKDVHVKLTDAGWKSLAIA